MRDARECDHENFAACRVWQWSGRFDNKIDILPLLLYPFLAAYIFLVGISKSKRSKQSHCQTSNEFLYLLTDQSQTKLFRHQTTREKHARSIEICMYIYVWVPKILWTREAAKEAKKKNVWKRKPKTTILCEIFISALGWWSKFLLCECKAEASKESERWWWRCDMM